ncbi:putative uncharacterized protein DDB_G0282133 [Leptopilina boulardi]|uniref:putative uncharacterized protein DDB_G0282133 n=1 Tax=Leptopilina boulardi TaxID=63433 RepID=UPI0021F64F11|nr:putative uncharacterized protein DDB_G0282133 [Leptopilina boulardi]
MNESTENDWDLTTNDDNNGKIDNTITKNLPAKSKEKYEAVYQHFTAWQAAKKIKNLSENVVLSYFNELIGKVKPPTLWARYSMLKSTLKINNNIDIRSYTQLNALLRKESKGYKSEKPKILSSKEILEFLNNAPDHNYLATKVAIIFAICGSLKKGELCEIRTSNIKDFGSHLIVKVQNEERKNERTFFVHGELFYNLYKSYAELRPKNIVTTRFFVNYNYGKCTQQVIGINKFGAMPKQVAKYLNLPNFECYTGHSIRRTSAQILSDLGAICNDNDNNDDSNNYHREIRMKNLLTTKNNDNNSLAKRAKIENASTSNNDTSKGRINFKVNLTTRDENKMVNLESKKTTTKVRVQYENLSLDNLYNADESRINWRPLNNNKNNNNNSTENNDSDDDIENHDDDDEDDNDDDDDDDDEEKSKKISDNITTLFCGNATGSHRIPLLTIGDNENPECLEQFMNSELREKRLKFFQKFNVVYTHGKKSKMDKEIFLLWYKFIFIPSVIEHQKKSGITGKVILIIDNDQCHPPLNELNAINKNFQILPLPSNMTFENQPMNQGLVSLTKKHYKNNLLKQALLSRHGTENYIKKFNLHDCLQLIGEAWDNINSATLKKVWKTFLSDSQAINNNSKNNNNSSSNNNNNNNNLSHDPLLTMATKNNFNESSLIVEESKSFLQNKGDQLSQLLSESNWSTNENKEKFLEWFNDEVKTKKIENKNISNDKNCQLSSASLTVIDDDKNEMQRNYMEMKQDFSELRNEFAELRNKFMEIKNELNFEKRKRKLPNTTNDETTRTTTTTTTATSLFEDSMNFEDCMENEFLPIIKDEIDNDDEDNDDDNDNDDEDVENIEIEESKSFLDDNEMEKNSTLQKAFIHFNEFKTWMKLSNKFTTKHYNYIEEIENIMKQEM